jgi:hypothetical protein
VRLTIGSCDEWMYRDVAAFSRDRTGDVSLLYSVVELRLFQMLQSMHTVPVAGPKVQSLAAAS